MLTFRVFTSSLHPEAWERTLLAFAVTSFCSKRLHTRCCYIILSYLPTLDLLRAFSAMASASEMQESTTTTASFYDVVKRDPPIPSQGDSKAPELLKQLTKQSAKLKAVDDEQQKMSDILNAILPPREFEHGHTSWIQRTATDVPSREDVKALRSQIDVALAERQARESGICPVREDLYSQTFGGLCIVCFGQLVHVTELYMSTMMRSNL